MVDSPFILLQATILRTEKGENRRGINVSKCFKALGPERCKALVVFHVFTDCDQTGRFNNKSKTACWKAFLGSSDTILQTFGALKQKIFRFHYVILTLKRFVVSKKKNYHHF